MCELAGPTQFSDALRETDPAGVAGLSEPVRLRLFRDYPDYRHLLADSVQLSATEQQWIQEDFLTQDFLTQVAQWLSFDPGQQLRYLADPDVANWAAAYRVWDYFQLGMAAEYLADLIRQLNATNRARLLTQADLVTHSAHTRWHSAELEPDRRRAGDFSVLCPPRGHSTRL